MATEELKLNTHVVDTFTGWTPPNPFNIIIAVSFGLFVPSRLLNAAQYRGLNVHPSLLPDFRGSAPIHHTLLRGRSSTGVTVQTLHPKHFDHGDILAQTPSPGIKVGMNATPSELIDQLGHHGGQLLVDVLQRRAFVPPLDDAGWYARSGGPIDHAEKITPQHRYIDFATATIDDIAKRQQVLGKLWCCLPNGERIIFESIIPSGLKKDTETPGLFVSTELNCVLAQSADGHLMQITTTVAGGGKGRGNGHVRRVLAAKNITH